MDDHAFPTDRFAVHVDVAVEKMLGLGIERIAKNFFDENLSAAGRGDDPNQNAQCNRYRPKPRPRVDVVDLAVDAVIF